MRLVCAAPTKRSFRNGLVAFGLFRLDDTKQSHRHQATRERGLLAEDQDIERIAVFPPRSRDESKVEGESRSHGQQLIEAEEAELFVELVFTPTPRRRLDHDVHRPSDVPPRAEISVIRRRFRLPR